MASRLGTIKPSVESRVPTQRIVGEEAFGANVGRGLNRLSAGIESFSRRQELENERDEKELELERERIEREKQQVKEKKDRARISSDLIRFQTDLNKELLTMQTSAERGAPNFSKNYDEHLKRRINEWSAANIDAEYQDEFQSRLANLESSLSSSAFAFERQAGGEAYLLDVADYQEQAINEILEGSATAEDWAATLSDFFADSPLSANETEKLRRNSEKLLQGAQLSVDMRQAALEPDLNFGTVPGASEDGSDIVAAGLPGVARGLLNTIAGTEAQGYNVIQGGGTFSDYSEHPNRKDDKSTAAGRYQFVYATWLEAKEALDLPDFSPESQDRAAWWLAQRDYKRRTGRNLEADLLSGSPEIMGQVRRVLGGHGSGEEAVGVTWEGLQHIKDGAFMDGVSNWSGTPPAQLHSERYDAIPFHERLVAWQDAQKFALDQLSRENAQAEARNTQLYQELQFNVLAGEAGLAEIENARANLGLTPEKYTGLLKAYEEANKNSIAVGEFTAKLSNPMYEFDPTADKDSANLFAEEFMLPSIREGDAEEMASVVIPTIDRLGFIPPNAARALAEQALSHNPQASAFAMESLDQIRGLDVMAFTKSVDDQLQKDVITYNTLKPYLSPEELHQRLQAQRDPAMQTALAAARTEMTSLIKEQINDFAVPKILDRMNMSEVIVDNVQGAELFRDFNALYQEFYPTIRNHQLTIDAVNEKLKTVWGQSGLGGRTYSMKHPPERYYPTYQEGHNWIEDSVRADLGYDAQTTFRLAADTQTEAEIERAKTGQISRGPSYTVIRTQPDGTALPEMATDEEGNLTGYPVRVFFEFTEENQQEKQDHAVWSHEVTLIDGQLRDVTSQIEHIEADLNRPIFPASTPELQKEREIYEQNLRDTLGNLKKEEARLITEREGYEEVKPEYTKTMEERKDIASRTKELNKELQRIYRDKSLTTEEFAEQTGRIFHELGNLGK